MRRLLQSNSHLFQFGISAIFFRALMAFDASSLPSSAINNTTSPLPSSSLPCQMLIIFSPLNLPSIVISTRKPTCFLILNVKRSWVRWCFQLVPTFYNLCLVYNVSTPNLACLSWTRQDQLLMSLLVSSLLWNHTTSCWPLSSSQETWTSGLWKDKT